jgi:hypothetical protein
MKQYHKALLAAAFPLTLLACNQQPEKTDEELCNCVKYQMSGEMNLAITEECVEAFSLKFGEQLDGMEEWYVKNCPAPDLQIKEEGDVITVNQ